jgi:hypothetical protein
MVIFLSFDCFTPSLNIRHRCIATLAGTFPFALGAATFGSVVYEDRLLNVSSDKTVSAVETSIIFNADFQMPSIK